MSLLTPEFMDVKTYKWDDVGAPTLDRTATSLQNIFKACLVTGYGSKAGAEWTMPYEDLTAKVKVFRPKITGDTDFYLRCSSDNGTQMTAQVYLSMTAQNKGALKLQCETPFKYAKAPTSGKWLLIASPRGVWFFCEQIYAGEVDTTGSYFFCGDTSASDVGDKLVYLQHTGGSYDDGDFSNIMGYKGNSVSPPTGDAAYIQAKTLNNQGVVAPAYPLCIANGFTVYTNQPYTMQPIITRDNKMYFLPALFLPLNGAVEKNFATKEINQNLTPTTIINFSGSGNGATNTYISTDRWVY